MQKRWIVLLVAGALVASGAVLFGMGRNGDDFAWVAYAPLADDPLSFGGTGVHFLTNQQMVGLVAAWIGSLLAVGVLGFRIAARRR